MMMMATRNRVVKRSVGKLWQRRKDCAHGCEKEAFHVRPAPLSGSPESPYLGPKFSNSPEG